ncbi:DNA-methyltransferase [Rhizobium leguminosarum]|uniref:DNA-methyltransferase n=1 Tax=Rhizobium leguminosarum TaxID=384 RepID=UPI001C94DE38|nr:site-specific DNA-methyltransferase [Rhizobium leguminosarum]MBY5698430.1 site-specific DNA-methyltransferase [Rhizobium leguminosarum]
MSVSILVGDCRQRLSEIPSNSVNTCVTSPPYFGLRNYGVGGQIGLENDPAEFISAIVETFREVRRVLADDGTVWLNLGDSYAGGGCGARDAERWPKQSRNDHMPAHAKKMSGLKPKNLMGIPWRVALALQDDGWYLRQDIIWSKPNPMPESVADRCTKSHEYIFLLSKSPTYYFDQTSILEPVSPNSHARVSQDVISQIGSARAHGGAKTMKAVSRNSKAAANDPGVKFNSSFDASVCLPVQMRNKRSVWTVTTRGFSGAHFATFPPQLIEPCIKAGCPAGGTVLDPFGGAGTTGLVAERLGRSAVLIELNPAYAELARARIANDTPLMTDVRVVA